MSWLSSFLDNNKNSLPQWGGGIVGGILGGPWGAALGSSLGRTTMPGATFGTVGEAGLNGYGLASGASALGFNPSGAKGGLSGLRDLFGGVSGAATEVPGATIGAGGAANSAGAGAGAGSSLMSAPSITTPFRPPPPPALPPPGFLARLGEKASDVGAWGDRHSTLLKTVGSGLGAAFPSGAERARSELERAQAAQLQYQLEQEQANQGGRAEMWKQLLALMQGQRANQPKGPWVNPYALPTANTGG